jgi:hypothetical protein
MPEVHARTSPDGSRRFSHSDSGFTAAFELVMTPALFGFFGFLLDNKLRTGPLFTVVLTAIVAVYEVWKLWYHYNLRVDSLHAEIMRPKTVAATASSASIGDDA